MNIRAALTRRNVHRIIVAYLFLAWLLMQVTDIVGPVLGLPQAALEFGIRAAVTLFPVVLIFAWCFKWTPRGLFQHFRDHPQVQEARPNRLLGSMR